MLRLKCPKCKASLRIDRSQAGASVHCSECGVKLRVPSSPAAKAPAPQPSAQFASEKPQRKAGTLRHERKGSDEASAPDPGEEKRKRRHLEGPVEPEHDDADADRARPLARVNKRRPDKNLRDEDRFECEPYAPEGGVAAAGVPVLFSFVLAGAIFFGWLVAFVGKWLYLVFLSPIAVGFGIFGAGYLGVRLGKVRNPGIASLAGLLGGCVAMLTVHYTFYLQTLAEVPRLRPEEKSHLMWSPKAFALFFDARAEDGVRLSSSRAGPTSSGVNLGYVGSYIYWFGEWLLVAAIGLGGMLLAASEPFCARCKRWKHKHKLGVLDGPQEEVLETLTEGRVADLAQFAPAPKDGPLLLTASVCPMCKKGDIDIKVEQVTKNYKGEEKKTDLLHLTYGREALVAFESVFRGSDGDSIE